MVDLSVVIPAYNEQSNVEALIGKLETSLSGLRWEAIYVDDDSPDGTADLVRQLAREKPYVRCIQRVGRRGLSSAVIEGIMSSSAPYVAVIDGDLQHDESRLPGMLAMLQAGDAEIVVGSRYMNGGGVGEWDGTRVVMSRLATKISRFVVRDALTDPMSGFFMIKTDTFRSLVSRLSGEGYKILLDIFASSPMPLRFKEYPYEFRNRLSGESKVDTLVLWEYLMLILDKKVGRYIPPRFFLFSIVGGSGVFVHFLCLGFMYKVLALPFNWSQLGATFVAMTSNFALNNLLTYRDKRLKGFRLLTGLLSFYAVCGLGVAANVGVASFVFERDYSWLLAGLAGAIVGTVWNYAATSLFTWRRK